MSGNEQSRRPGVPEFSTDWNFFALYSHGLESGWKNPRRKEVLFKEFPVNSCRLRSRANRHGCCGASAPIWDRALRVIFA
jgi:hypothetical protein